MDAGFARLIIEGDNVNVIIAISSSLANHSLLGNVVDDIRHLIHGLQWASVSRIWRGLIRLHMFLHNMLGIL